MPTGTFPRIIQLQDGSYATPDGKGGWAPYSGTLPGGGTTTPQPDFKIGDPDAISHAWDVVQSINDSKELASKPLATGTLSSSVTSIPIVGGIIGQPRANLQTKLGQVAGDLRQLGIKTLYQQTGQKGVGSVARNQSEQQALQSSLAPIGFIDDGKGHVVPTGAQPDAPTLIQGLNTAQGIYYRHLAKLYNLNPDDPNTMKLLDAASADPKVRSTLLNQAATAVQNPSAAPAAPASTTTDNGITKSNPPPAITAVDNHEATSTETQVATDPNMLRIKPHLEALLAADPAKVSNSYILNYMHQNGVDPGRTSIVDALNYRVSKEGAAWRAKGGNYGVDPTYNQPLTGVKRTMAEVAGATPGGVPVGATIAGAGDTATMGAIPDIAGIVHGVTGVGPTRADVIHARDVSAAEHPYGTLAGNIIGAVGSPLGRGGGLARTALNTGLYGALGSEDPSLSGRLQSAIIGSLVGAAAHGAGGLALKGGTGAYRAGRGVVGGEVGADANALAHAADKMPGQDPSAIAENLINLRANGTQPPIAAALNRGGQDFLARLSSSSPAARVAADQAATAYRQSMPAELADHFDNAIAAATPEATDAAQFLNRPTRQIAGDVQDMAGKEYETGMAPIAKEPVTLTPELTDTLGHERIIPAIKDALANHNLDAETRTALRGLPGQLKALNVEIPGGNPDVVAGIRAKYAQGINVNVDTLRNVATSLDRTASKLQEGSEGQLQLRSISRDIRDQIQGQYPEYGSVNARYASRMRGIDAMDVARRNFLGESPEQIDALAKGTENLSAAPNESQYRGAVGAEPSGGVQPSDRQFAMAGAREAATTKAGAGTGTGGGAVAKQLAEGPNQQTRNAMVLNDQAGTFGSRAAATSQVADVIDRITNTGGADQTAKWFNLAKRALATKLTGGVSHYAVGSALAGLPNMTGADAARVTRIMLDSDNADMALSALTKSYGAAKARSILARMAAVPAAAGAVRAKPPAKRQAAIGSPL